MFYVLPFSSEFSLHSTENEKDNLLPAHSSRLHKAWPWLVLVFAATDVIFLGGKRRAFGSFVSELNLRYNGSISLSELNWIGDSYSAVGYMCTTVSTFIILSTGRRFRLFQTLGAVFILASCVSSALVPNPHWLFLSHTLLHGLGSSLVLSVTGLIVNEYFAAGHPYRILATTLVSGGSVGSMIFVMLFAAVIQTFGWRDALWILGILYFVVMLIGVPVFVKNPNFKDYVADGSCGSICCNEDISFYKRTPLLVLWIFDRVLTSIITYGLLMNLTDFVRRTAQGRNLVSSSTLTTAFTFGEAITYVIGALIMGLTKTFFKQRLRYILLTSTVVMATCLCVLEVVRNNMAAAISLTFFAGMGLGPSITFLFPAGEEFTTLPGHMAYPFSLSGMGLGMILSPLMSAVIAEHFRYHWFFLTLGALCWIKAGCLVSGMVYLSRHPELIPEAVEITELQEEMDEHAERKTE